MLYKLLVVDDHKGIIAGIEQTFKGKEFSVISAFDGKTGIEKAKKSRPDVILLDIEMPQMDGYEAIKELKKDEEISWIPVIFLTGTRIKTEDKCHGLDIGAVDYITKPFDETELVLRIRNAVRRVNYHEEIQKYSHFCGMELEPLKRELKIKGRNIDLTAKEFDLLFSFIKRKDKVLTYEYLLETVFGYECKGYLKTLENHISSLKSKLGPHCSKHIENIRGRGYIFHSENKS